jgi:naphthoate synthase
MPRQQLAGSFLLDRIDAATAERWGLVNAVVPADELMPTEEGARAFTERRPPDFRRFES